MDGFVVTLAGPIRAAIWRIAVEVTCTLYEDAVFANEQMRDLFLPQMREGSLRGRSVDLYEAVANGEHHGM